MSAAERAGDPYLVAAGAFRLGFVFLNARRFDQAEETARTAAEALDGRVDADQTALSLWGALTLQRALAAARAGHAEAAYEFIEQARQAAERLGPGRNDYNTEFGPLNVAVHEVHVAVELGDAGLALRAAAAVDTSTLSAERQARMLIDVARAHAQRRQPAEVGRAAARRAAHPGTGTRPPGRPADRHRPAADAGPARRGPPRPLCPHRDDPPLLGPAMPRDVAFPNRVPDTGREGYRPAVYDRGHGHTGYLSG